MIKKYNNFIKEGLNDFLKGPSEDDILKNILKDNPIKPYGLFKNKDNIKNLLVKSCKSGSLKGVKLAIENGADVFCYNELPIKYATEYNNIDVIKYLYEYDSSVINNKNLPYLISIALQLDDITIIDYFIKNFGKKYNPTPFYKKEMMKIVVFQNNIKSLKYLIDLGYDYNFDDGILIRNAAVNNYYEIVDYLLSLGGFELWIDKRIYDIAKEKNYKELMDVAIKYHLNEW